MPGVLTLPLTSYLTLPLTSYQLWMAEERPKLKASAATAAMGPKEAMAELGRRWKLLDAAGKQPYEARAARLKQVP